MLFHTTLATLTPLDHSTRIRVFTNPVEVFEILLFLHIDVLRSILQLTFQFDVMSPSPLYVRSIAVLVARALKEVKGSRGRTQCVAKGGNENLYAIDEGDSEHV